MLVLRRKQNEAIVINDVIKVTVVEIQDVEGKKAENGYVRLGIEAPRTIEIHRQEIYDQIYGKSPEKGGET